jgi:hypothetical protein
MATTTPNFGWSVPTSTDLVKDGATAIELLGDSIDASLVDLKGGTTGQILSKASNADMDFVFITNDIGDITGVTASSPLTGGGTSGAITVGIQDALTTQKGAVQLSDSTSTTSSVLAATPTAVKSAYDLADAAVAKSTIDAKGDVLAGTADNTIARLAVGANGTVLTADSGETTGLKWAAPAGGLTLVKTQTIGTTVSSVTVTDAFSATYDNYMIVVNGGVGSAGSTNLGLQLGSTTTGYYAAGMVINYSNAAQTLASNNNAASFTRAGVMNTGDIAFFATLQDPFLTKVTKVQTVYNSADTNSQGGFFNGFLNSATSHTAFTIAPASGTLTGGTIRVYGYANS